MSTSGDPKAAAKMAATFKEQYGDDWYEKQIVGPLGGFGLFDAVEGVAYGWRAPPMRRDESHSVGVWQMAPTPRPPHQETKT